eukprot:NODE_23077_length_681_cov_5.942238.p3 GENE.NODE_23077_length_681_cov_5.942238~~NODE_23077_length_681_cov_5.942238.p3  ORF type:complete len:55 (-),score=6.85 NODE_23077_length_681_cov_5.942238:328-492(-)
MPRCMLQPKLRRNSAIIVQREARHPNTRTGRAQPPSTQQNTTSEACGNAVLLAV